MGNVNDDHLEEGDQHFRHIKHPPNRSKASRRPSQIGSSNDNDAKNPNKAEGDDGLKVAGSKLEFLIASGVQSLVDAIKHALDAISCYEKEDDYSNGKNNVNSTIDHRDNLNNRQNKQWRSAPIFSSLV